MKSKNESKNIVFQVRLKLTEVIDLAQGKTVSVLISGKKFNISMPDVVKIME